jgi:hypothetical protein
MINMSLNRKKFGIENYKMGHKIHPFVNYKIV